jgi:hypothetical protein
MCRCANLKVKNEKLKVISELKIDGVKIGGAKNELKIFFVLRSSLFV